MSLKVTFFCKFYMLDFLITVVWRWKLVPSQLICSCNYVEKINRIANYSRLFCYLPWFWPFKGSLAKLVFGSCLTFCPEELCCWSVHWQGLLLSGSLNDIPVFLFLGSHDCILLVFLLSAERVSLDSFCNTISKRSKF